jgi:hypothetical protein
VKSTQWSPAPRRGWSTPQASTAFTTTANKPAQVAWRMRAAPPRYREYAAPLHLVCIHNSTSVCGAGNG